MLETIGKYCEIQSQCFKKDNMEELWKLVQDKERIIDSQRDQIDRLKAEIIRLRKENTELQKQVTVLTQNDRCV